MDKKPVNILCLDGGGVRGLSSLLILRELMEQLKKRSELPRVPLPCDVFDMICGTSTGGLIALMLGRLRMSVQEAITVYLDFSKAVFGEKKSKLSLIPCWAKRRRNQTSTDSIYDAYVLEKWVKKIVAKSDRDGLLEDPLGADQCCRTFVVAACRDHVSSPAKLFRSYAPAETCRIWEAARATTAAVPFFDAATFGVPRETYIDGSFSLANNPSELAIQEVRSAFPGRRIHCFLSLGTGVPDVISIAEGRSKVAEACMKLVKDCERIHDKVANVFDGVDEALGIPYFRFSVNMGLNKIEIDEWNREEDLAGITGGYMRGYEQKQRSKQCIERLASKAAQVAAKQREENSLM